MRVVPRHSFVTTFVVAFLSFTSQSNCQAATTFEFRDGDRVLLLGSTFIERAQRYGYIEAELTAALAAQGKSVTFRNLGWSGDTVWADSRGIFDPPAEGYQRMIEQVKGLKPTVLLLYYGANEAFAGERGLERFLTQYRKLLDDLRDTEARLILVSPLDHLDFSERHPNPDRFNQQVLPYRDAIETLASERQATFVDLSGPLGAKSPLGSPDDPTVIPAAAMTDSGVHLNAFGYKLLAQVLREALLGPSEPQKLHITTDASSPASELLPAVAVSGGNIQFTLHLPRIQFPGEVVPTYRLQVSGLKPGRYTLQEGEETLLTLSHEQWAQGAPLYPVDVERFESLRTTILAKNELYFHRWRPQNITYLYLFRKHEQGQNAAEIPQFDPLIEERENTIRELSRPIEYHLSLVPATSD